MNPQHLVARELTANAAALRALARALVGPADAADLVQETALRALRSPPAEPRGMAAWLATTLRNLAGNHRRSARRRHARERVAGLRVVDPPPADADVLRREQLSAVTEMLWRLPEPYQSALVWRYFENLTPKQIAAQKGIPLATVKSRLQRGLTMLRDESDRRDGGRWRALLPAALGANRTPTAAAATAVLIMTPMTKVLSTAAILVAVACLVFVLDRNEALPPANTARLAETPAAASAATSDEPGPQNARELVAVASAMTAVSLVHPYAFRLRCRVLDRDGLPVRGAKIALGPRDCAPNTWPESSNGDGIVELHWRGKKPSMAMSVGLIFRGHAQSLREVELLAGSARELVLLAEFGAGGVTCSAAMHSQNLDCRLCHHSPVLPNVFADRLTIRNGLHPESRFADRLAAFLVDNDATEEEEEDERVVEFDEDESSDRGGVAGLVLGHDGKPVAGATVIWGAEPDQPIGRTRTEDDGTFLLKGVLAGTWQVRAGGGCSGIGRAIVDVFAGQTASCALQLARGHVLAGRVQLPAGEPTAGWRVEYEADDGTWVDGTRVRIDGSFVFANLPRGTGRLLLWSRNAYRLPAALDKTVRVGSTDVVVDLRTVGLPAGQLRVSPAAAAVDVWVLQLDSRRGAMAQPQSDGSFVLDGMAPGFYRVAIGSVAVGWRDLGEHWVDGHGLIDLGSVPLRGAGRLSVRGLTHGQPFELYQRRPDLDLRSAQAIDVRSDMHLPPGRWLALWRTAEKLQMHEFEVGLENEVLFDLAAKQR